MTPFPDGNSFMAFSSLTQGKGMLVIAFLPFRISAFFNIAQPCKGVHICSFRGVWTATESYSTESKTRSKSALDVPRRPPRAACDRFRTEEPAEGRITRKEIQWFQGIKTGLPFLLKQQSYFGGDGEIRTLVPVTRQTHFECAPL